MQNWGRQHVEVQGRSAGSGRTSRRALSRRSVVVAPQGRIEAVVARTRGARHVQPPLRGKRTPLVRAEARRRRGRRGAQDRLLVVEECQRAPRWARGRRREESGSRARSARDLERLGDGLRQVACALGLEARRAVLAPSRLAHALRAVARLGGGWTAAVHPAPNQQMQQIEELLGCRDASWL